MAKTFIIGGLPLMANANEVQFWIEKLRSEQEEIRRAAIKKLIEIGRGAEDPLINLLQDGNKYVRLGAVEVLAWISDSRVLELLKPLLKDEYEWVRYAAVCALERMDGPSVVPYLIDALTDEHTWVRYGALCALAKIGDPRARPFIEARLNDECEWIRRTARQVLEKRSE
ncbi:MAG: HEAT repeat domain-containing protein [Candidatus Methanomethyliaceae archaeon]